MEIFRCPLDGRREVVGIEILAVRYQYALCSRLTVAVCVLVDLSLRAVWEERERERERGSEFR